MDFTREPIIETVITPKEGCKLVVRSSHAAGQEEFFVDAVQVVSFGHSFFFRSLERPKTFLVPVSDYEIVEVREPRMVLKNVGVDRSIKIAGGREGSMRSAPREPAQDAPQRQQRQERQERQEPEAEPQGAEEARPSAQGDRTDKRRDRRRNVRRRRGRDEIVDGETTTPEGDGTKEPTAEGASPMAAQQVVTTSILHALLPPPPRLISETIEQYRDTYKDAFYSKEEQKQKEPAPKPSVELNPPEYGSYEMTPEEEEAIYQMRKKQGFNEEHHKEEHHATAPDSPPDAQRFLSDMEENRPHQES